FAVTIPNHPLVESLKRSSDRQEVSLPLEDASLHDLPPTFLCKGRRLGVSALAYVEFYLEATMQGSSNKTSTAVKPVMVGLVSSPFPITDFKHEKHFTRQKISSQCLLPGMEGVRLSLGQKMKKMISSAEVPQFSFDIQYDSLSVLQIGNPHSVLFQLRANPISKHTSTILNDKPQIISIEKFSLVLTSISQFKYRYIGPREKPAGANTGARLKQEYQPDSFNVPTELESAPLDLGREFGLNCPSRSGRTDVFPTFTTYNMRNKHYLECELVLTVAGEEVTCKMQHPVTILGPSNDQPW
ncbi:hypothetical protein OIDMADRAFT_139473, partial [Oidiodendron maius Zn]